MLVGFTYMDSRLLLRIPRARFVSVTFSIPQALLLNFWFIHLFRAFSIQGLESAGSSPMPKFEHEAFCAQKDI
jgi:hypothetical protein